jgi:hypothetical protein
LNEYGWLFNFLKGCYNIYKCQNNKEGSEILLMF